MGKGRVHLLHGDRAVAIKTEIAQGTEHGIGRAFLQLEKDGVAVRPSRGPVEHDQVLHTRSHGQPREQRTGDTRGAHDADVQHHEPTSAGSREPAGSRMMRAGMRSLLARTCEPTASTRISPTPARTWFVVTVIPLAPTPAHLQRVRP